MSPAVERALGRFRPDREPVAIERPRQGNHKTTAIARYENGQPIVVQTADDAESTAVEAAVLSAITERTTVPVPPLLASGSLDGHSGGYLVTEHVPGKDLHEEFVDLSRSRRCVIAKQFGTVLGQLHEAFSFDSAGQLRVADDGELAAAGRGMDEWFRSLTERALSALSPDFDDLRPALAEAMEPLDRSNPPRLFPWDLRPGNAVVRDGTLVAVLDWGEPRAADPALSVAKTEHLLTRWYGTTPEPLEAAFRGGYESIRPLPAVPPAYRVAAVVSAAVDSAGAVTRPHYPERTGDDAVAIHREWLAERLDGADK